MSLDAPLSPIIDEDEALPVSDLDTALRNAIDARRSVLVRQAKVLRVWRDRVSAPAGSGAEIADGLTEDMIRIVWTEGR